MEKCFIRDGYSTVNVGLLDGYGNIYLMKTITEKFHLPNVVLGWEIYLGVETLQTNLRYYLDAVPGLCSCAESYILAKD